MTKPTRLMTAILTLALLAPAAASAQAAERPFYVGGGLGGALELDSYPSQFMLAEEIGYHLFGTSDGLFIGGAFAQSFGDNVTTLQFGARIGYDIEVYRGADLGVMLAPSVAPGIAVAFVDVNTPFGRSSGSDSAFNFQGAFDVKLLLLDDALEVFLRPAGIDIFATETGTGARWNVLAGATARF